jgi:tetraacyldisaccharide 4'-kinase
MAVIDTFWHRIRPAHLVLYPASLLFGALVAARRWLHAHGMLHSERLPVPVIVVGNISVGGTGKTPLVIGLARALARHGFKPGIITRGYGGTSAVQPVTPQADPARAGDEPVLLAQRSGCPVWTGRRRVQAARALLAANPECDVLISDDGLQHYAMQRDIEIAVVDGRRQFGNGLLLPAGPLREPPRRLESVDAVVVNGGSLIARVRARQYSMELRGTHLANLADPGRVESPQALSGRRVHAVAGIGNPQRFFDHLRALGLEVRPQPFPDHFAFTPADLAFAGDDPVVMTEKDAVKCRAFARASWWYLPVEAQVDAQLERDIIQALEGLPQHGRQAP